VTVPLQPNSGDNFSLLYDARSESIEGRRIKVNKMLARGFSPSQMASALGVKRHIIHQDISSVRGYIARELQGSDTMALIAESLGVFEEVRASALKDMDQANTAQERAIARRDLVRVEGERMRCVLMAAGGGPGRGMLNVTPATIEADPVPQLEEEHQKLMKVARNLVSEVLLVEGPSSDEPNTKHT
jgi:hypothetical protein